MNYAIHYNRLIDRARNRILEGYFERHHIIPKCMNGSNDSNNLVNLTAREHFVAHQLLVKMYPSVGGLIAAVRYLTASKNGKVNNRMYEWLRIKHSIQMSKNNRGRKPTPEQIKKAADSHIGKKRSAESKVKMSISASKRVISEAGKLSLKQAKKKENEFRAANNIPHHNLGKILSEERKLNIGLQFKGRKQTPEQIAKRVASRQATLAANKVKIWI